VLYWNI